MERAVDAVRATPGIERLNLDLIYGTPGESVDDWRRDARRRDRARSRSTSSAYALDGRARHAARPRHRRRCEARRRTTTTRPTSTRSPTTRSRPPGYEWYEISNWARPGEECRHNLLYWEGDDYLAIGCAAHGKTGDRRWWNLRTPERYIEAIAGRDLGRSRVTRSSTRPVAADESLASALRTRAGIPTSPRLAGPVDDLVAAKLVVRENGRVRLTRSGRLLATEVTLRLHIRADGPPGPARCRPGSSPEPEAN